MNNLRLILITEEYPLKLTTEESPIIGYYNYQNPSFLMEDRGEFKHTHPEYPGPFTKETVKWYHIYCSFELWLALEKKPTLHWDYRGDFGYKSYNPFNNVCLNTCDMCLPIIQRNQICELNELEPEIFENLRPYYC